METIEVLIYMAIAVIIGGVVLSFLVDWDTQKTYDDLSETVGIENTKSEGFEKVDRYGFIAKLYQTWKDCGFGEEEYSRVLYVEGKENESISKSFLFKELKKLNYCNTLQSKDYDCGKREDVVFDHTLDLPALVTVTCQTNTLYIES